MDRRDFLKFIGAASGATVLSSCGVEKSAEKIIPLLISADENYIPGEATYQNSTCTECPAGCGMSVKIVDFNPIKLEGAVNHPLNDGALCLRGQASLMRLYHPERIKTPLVPRKGELLNDQQFEGISWDEAFKKIVDGITKAQNEGRQSVYFSGRTTGSLSSLIDDFCNNVNVERLPEYETIAYTNLREAYKTLFGKPVIPAFKIENSDFLLTVGADIVETFIKPVSHAVQLQRAKKNHPFKWIHFEPHASLTGFKATERKVLKPGSETDLLLFLLNHIIESKLAKNHLPIKIRELLPKVTKRQASEKTGFSADFLDQLTNELGASKNPLVIAGGVSTQQANGLEVALVAGLIQWVYGMTDSTLDFSTGEDYSKVGNLKDIANFSQQLEGDQIGVVFVTKTDPLFKNLPADISLTKKLKKAGLRIAFTDIIPDDKEQQKILADTYDLILPLSHSLESWGDMEGRRGLTNIMQPAIKETLFDSKTEGDILLNLTGRLKGPPLNTTYEEWIKARWSTQSGGVSLEAVLQNGYFKKSLPKVKLSLDSQKTLNALRQAEFDATTTVPVLFAIPSIRTYDGRSSVLPLTREVPDPLTTISHGKWVSISEASARDLGLTETTLVTKYRDEVIVEAGGNSNKLGSMVQKGLPKNVYTVYLDQLDAGTLSYDKRTGECLTRIDGVKVSKTGKMKPLAIMAGSLEQGKRKVIPSGSPDEHEHHGIQGDETLYQDPYRRYKEYRWSMNIDMESCIGCSACVSACYMENNIPCVGEEENIDGREMSWIRVQPYYSEEGSMDSLVMLCQQCDFAPCENVCPVYATYHNDEGLNVMVYNRCVGTRYCVNNCPYKVRRFNWWDWTDRGAWKEPMTRMLNPDIWVRPKGVMEKCTFCIQRIRTAKDVANDEDRKVRDGEVIPACAQTCPTNAITFGNYLDQDSEVYKKSQAEDKFRVFESLGVSPAIHYLRKEKKA